jgi:hypothetical protein
MTAPAECNPCWQQSATHNKFAAARYRPSHAAASASTSPTRISCTSEMLMPITTCKQSAAGSTCPFGCKTCSAVAGTSLPAGCYTANTGVNCIDPADGAVYAGNGACPTALPSVPSSAAPTNGTAQMKAAPTAGLAPTLPPVTLATCESGAAYDPACKQYPDTPGSDPIGRDRRFVSQACPKETPFLNPATLHCHSDLSSAYICCYGSAPTAAPTNGTEPPTPPTPPPSPSPTTPSTPTPTPVPMAPPTMAPTTAMPSTDKMAGTAPLPSAALSVSDLPLL